MRHIIHPEDVEAIQLVGRTMRRLITFETVGAQRMSMGVISVPPGAEVLPCHSHEAEEALYIVEGAGEFWIDGERGTFGPGDVVWYPYSSKHMIRNTGNIPLLAVFIFAPPMDPDRYHLYDDTRFS
jgi:mannose-6-phosphate isomerase-like protein (cupin superfamily)